MNDITSEDNMSDVDNTQDGCDTPLDYKLTENQRDRIGVGQYIDFDLLTHENAAKQSMKVQPSADGSSVIVNQVDEASQCKIKTVDRWVSTFAIYTYVTLQTRPLEAPHMFHYMEHIREMARQNEHWLAYVEQFRCICTMVLAKFPWNKSNLALMFKCLKPSGSPHQSSFHPYGREEV